MEYFFLSIVFGLNKYLCLLLFKMIYIHGSKYIDGGSNEAIACIAGILKSKEITK